MPWLFASINLWSFVRADEKYLGEDMDIDIRVVDNIPTDKSGKTRKVISTIKTILWYNYYEE